jgi:hypothetical protein
MPCSRPLEVLALLAGLGLLGACAPSDPPTVTPSPDATPITNVVEITVPAPRRSPEPVILGALQPYVEPEGRFSMSVPAGWTGTVQPASGQSDVVLGMVFQAPGGDGLLSVTHFDNGRAPTSIGATANAVLRDVSGWMQQPGYRELGRESVLERPGEALRIEIAYERNNGVPMHSLALFQIDGTVFSMVNVAVEEGSWASSEGLVRDMLASYRVPAGPTGPAGAATEPPAP